MLFELQIRSHARETPNLEVCGLVVRELDGKLIAVPTPNIADNPAESFRIPPVPFLKSKLSGDLVGYYHSHPNSGVEASPHDIEVADEIGLPAFIFSVPDDLLGVYIPKSYRLPLVGRKFCPLVADCVTLVWDYYARVLDVALPFLPRTQADYYRGVDFDFRHLLEAANVRIVHSPEPNDVIAMNLYGSRRANHLAVYLGGNRILHQTGERLSLVEVYGGTWEKATNHIFRHPQGEGRKAWQP